MSPSMTREKSARSRTEARWGAARRLERLIAVGALWLGTAFGIAVGVDALPLCSGPPVYGNALAGEADVVAVDVRASGDGTFRFDVAVRHADTGWDHYADLWEVVAPDGAVLGARVLLHPHVDEQPFTRGLSGVRIGQAIRTVRVRARDKADGYGGREMVVSVPGR